MKRSVAIPALPLALLLLGMLACGCRHPREVNPPLAAPAGDAGYYFHTRARPDNSPDTMFILCFSGGGTRAAALACGVLEELARTPVPGTPRRLLDEVDAISAVSGGSFTAAAYALHGEEAFGRLETNFLKRDIQGALVGRVLNPFRWYRLGSPYFSRAELAAELYDEVLFDGVTFGGLAARPGPYVAVNATDISSGARFGFSQHHFDLICADLAPLRVARAVAASSAVPGLLAPVTLNGYAGACDPPLPPALLAAARGQTTGLTGREALRMRELGLLLETNRPFLHLMDGGIADNLGVRAVLDGLQILMDNPEARGSLDFARLRRVAIVCVDARAHPERGWERREAPPGKIPLVAAAAGIPMDRYSQETLELLRGQVNAWQEAARRRRGETGGPPLEFYPVLVGFDRLPEAAERRYFQNLPTSFRLPAGDVDALREAGGRLLRAAPEYQDFLADLARP